MAARNRPPTWFWIAAIVILVWGAMGVFAFYMDRTMSAADVAKLPAFQRDFRQHQPLWTVWAYGIAVWSGLIGAVALLARSRHAHPVFVVSLVAVVVLFGWMFAFTGIIAAEGVVTAAGFPVFVAVVAAFQVWLAQRALRRRWIG